MRQIIGKFRVAYDTRDIFGSIQTLTFGVDRVDIVFNEDATSDKHRFVVTANGYVLGTAAYSDRASVFLDVRLDGPGLMAPICCELVCTRRDFDGEDADYDLLWERELIRTKAMSEAGLPSTARGVDTSCKRTSRRGWDRAAGPFYFDHREKDYLS